MDTRDNTLTTTIRGIIRQEIALALEVETEPFNEVQLEKIQEIVADFINHNIEVNISAY